jgi:hypothetical protein
VLDELATDREQCGGDCDTADDSNGDTRGLGDR